MEIKTPYGQHRNGTARITCINGNLKRIRLSRSDTVFEDYARVVRIWEKLSVDGDPPVALSKTNDEDEFELSSQWAGWEIEYLDDRRDTQARFNLWQAENGEEARACR